MSGRYLVELADVLRAAGLMVIEYNGWPSRSRSSGGYSDNRPWCVMWHHTASSPWTSPNDDAYYMCHTSSDRPIANLMVARDASVWVLAAGATNTNGKGGPWSTSRGTVPMDSMNTHAVGIEIQNDGLGEPYSAAVMDAAFRTSIAVGRHLDLDPTDCATHFSWAPTRKIDPATTDAVMGPWRPEAVTTSGTWSVADLQAEHARRWNEGDDDMPDETTFKRWMRDVLNEGTAMGLTSWAGTEQEILNVGRTVFNEVKVVQQMVGGLDEEAARAAVAASEDAVVQTD